MTGFYRGTWVVEEARPGRASSTTPPEQNELSFRMDPPTGGVVRNLTSHKKIKEFMCIMPDTH